MKKLILTFLFLGLCSSAWATAYYVKNGGNDGANGLTDGTAWATLNKVTTSTFAADDYIYFKRGSIWQNQTNILAIGQSGTEGHPITIDAYDTGANPIITSSLVSTTTGDWADRTGNVWRFSSAFFSAYDCGNIIFGSYGAETGTGTKKQTVGELATNGDFYRGSGYVDVYSVGNPVTRWTRINLAVTINAVEILGAEYDDLKSYITMQNIDVAYSGGNGILIKNTQGVIVQNCNVSYVGGGIQSGTTLYGEGIEMNSYNVDTTIYNNTLNQIFEGAISVQSNASTTVHRNINITYNTITNAAVGFMYSNTDAGSTTDNIVFEHNSVSGIGYSSFEGKSWSSSIWSHLLFYEIAGTVTNPVVCRYNTFTGGNLISNPPVGTSTSAGAHYLAFYRDDELDSDKVVIDSNDYVRPMLSANFSYIANPETVYQISGYDSWKTDTGYDANSTLVTGITYNGVTVNGTTTN